MTKHINIEEAQRIGGVFIDVRSPAEFESSHIEGSFNIPLEEINIHKQELSKLKENLVLVCRSGNRASRACSELETIRLSHSYILDGGIMALDNKKVQLSIGKQIWDIERQVRLIVGVVVLLSISIGYLYSSAFLLIGVAFSLGLTIAALSNSCMMGMMLMKLPYNRQTQIKHNGFAELMKLCQR